MFESWSKFWAKIARKTRVSGLALERRSTEQDDSSASGTKVVMLQIDGLGHSMFQKALKKGRLPFIKSLMENEGAGARPTYSGLPSTTPAVQSELFHGVAGAIPAFEYIKRETGESCIFFDPDCARELSGNLQKKGEGLFVGGSSYGNIITGGASETKYTTELFTPGRFLNLFALLRLLPLFILNIGKILRVAVLSLIEFGLAFYDFLAGVFNRRDFFKELKFVPMRIGVSIVLRELARYNLKKDIIRGRPIVQANFVGYDEQAHRRGPSSAFAHWTLKGIDGVARDIYRTAKRINEDCVFIVYSDHGQEATLPYPNITGWGIEKAVKKAITGEAFFSEYTWDPNPPNKQKTPNHRNRHLFNHGKNKGAPKPPDHNKQPKIKVVASGPLGHVYLFGKISSSRLERLAKRLVEKARIPLVLFRKKGRTVAVNDDGVFYLFHDPEKVFGPDYDITARVVVDLDRLCKHPDAGDLMISGWRPGEKPITFSVENGAHGGPGLEETTGFCLIQPDTDILPDIPRPLDIRRFVQEKLARKDEDESIQAAVNA